MQKNSKETTAIDHSDKLGFVYAFRTSYVNVYKLGFTETSIGNRHGKIVNRMGVSQIEAAVMTVDSRLQEAILFETAWKHADRIQTFLMRKRFKMSELFVLHEAGIEAVRAHLLNHVAQQPYLDQLDASALRLEAISKARAFNQLAASSCITLQGMDKIFRKLREADISINAASHFN